MLNSALLRLCKRIDRLRGLPQESFIRMAVAQIRRELLDRARQYRGAAWRYTHAADTCRGPRESRTEWDVEESAEVHRDLDDWIDFQETVEHLPLLEREVVSLSFYHHKTQDEIAELFQVSVRTVRQRWKWALGELEAATKQG